MQPQTAVAHREIDPDVVFGLGGAIVIDLLDIIYGSNNPLVEETTRSENSHTDVVNLRLVSHRPCGGVGWSQQIEGHRYLDVLVEYRLDNWFREILGATGNK